MEIKQEEATPTCNTNYITNTKLSFFFLSFTVIGLEKKIFLRESLIFIRDF